MSDITKCPGIGCPVKDDCYRFNAESGYRQSWFAIPPFESIFECDYFWEMEEHIIKE